MALSPNQKRLLPAFFGVIGFLTAIISGFDLIDQGKEKVGWLTLVGGVAGVIVTVVKTVKAKPKEN